MKVQILNALQARASRKQVMKTSEVSPEKNLESRMETRLCKHIGDMVKRERGLE